MVNFIKNPIISNSNILNVLTNEWQTIEDIKNKLVIIDLWEIRYLKIKLLNLEQNGKIISKEILNEKYWKLMTLREFKVNDFISLKLENNIVNVYVNNEKFRQCKYILLNIPIIEIEDFNNIESIDEAITKLDRSLEGSSPESLIITPEMEFWAHCSNIQAWTENNYDTRLLHSNIAFPLLKNLTKAGDKTAKKIFKEEIVKRLISGFFPVIIYLIKEGYLKYFNKEEVEILLDDIFSKIHKKEGSIAWAINSIAYFKLGDHEKAILAYNNLSKLEITEQNKHLWCDIAYSFDNEEKSIEIYKMILSVIPNDFISLNGLCNIYQFNNEIDKAIEECKNVLNITSNNDMAWFQLGHLYFITKKYNEALISFKKCLSINNKNAVAWEFLSSTYSELEEYDKSIKTLEIAIKMEPKNDIYWYNLGTIYNRVENYDKAIEAFKKALEIDKTFNDAWSGLGGSYANKGEFKEGINAIKNALKYKDKNIKDFSDFFNLGCMYAESENFKEALNTFNKYIEIEPEDPEGWFKLGRIYVDLKEYDKAINFFIKTLELDIEFEGAWSYLGTCFQIEGKIEQAIDSFKYVLEINSGSEYALQSLKEIYNKIGELNQVELIEHQLIHLNQDSSMSGSKINIEGTKEIEDNEFENLLIDSKFNEYEENKSTIEIDSITINKAMAPIYNFVINIRSIIRNKLKSFYGDDWWVKGIPKNIREAVEEKFEKKKRINPNRRYEKIKLLDFKNFNDILCNKKNWKNIFSEIFGEKHNILYPLERLRNIRNDIYHCNIFEADFPGLQFLIDDFLKYF